MDVRCLPPMFFGPTAKVRRPGTPNETRGTGTKVTATLSIAKSHRNDNDCVSNPYSRPTAKLRRPGVQSEAMVHLEPRNDSDVGARTK